MQEQIESWINVLTAKSNDKLAGRQIKYVLEHGRKYIKIVREEYWAESSVASQRWVHAFIDKDTGDIYKAAGWKAPAKNGARYNVVNDFQSLIQDCDPYGSYLYKR